MATDYQDKIVLFGDSLTQMGWDPELRGIGAGLANLYARKLDVLNRGFSGYNTDWALLVWEQIIAKREGMQAHTPRVRLVTIWFGANDACPPGSLQHVPLSRFSENLVTMVRAIKAPESPWYSPETKLLLITPPPIHVPSVREDIQLQRTFDVTRDYAEEVKKVGKAEDVPVVDAWTRVWEAAGQSTEGVKAFLMDGLHLNNAGYGVVSAALEEVIVQEYPELHHESLPSTFPVWGYFHSNTIEEFKAENWLDGRSRFKK